MKKRLLPLAIAGFLGLFAAAMMRQYLNQQRQALEAERQKLMADYHAPVDVIAALKDIPEGTTLTKEALGFVTIPEKFIQPYATRDAQDVIGKVTMAPLAEGEQILLNKLRRPEEAKPVEATLSKHTPEGKRAVTIVVDLISGVGGMVWPGDTVDVIWNFAATAQPGAGGGEGQLVTLVLFQNVQVLAVDHQLRGQSAEAETTGGRTANYTVTLALTPEEASMLLFAREQGRIQLSLRSGSEQEQRVAVKPTTLNSLTEAVLGAPPKPTEPPAPQERVIEVYKGLTRSTVPVAIPNPVARSNEEP